MTGAGDELVPVLGAPAGRGVGLGLRVRDAVARQVLPELVTRHRRAAHRARALADMVVRVRFGLAVVGVYAQYPVFGRSGGADDDSAVLRGESDGVQKPP